MKRCDSEYSFGSSKRSEAVKSVGGGDAIPEQQARTDDVFLDQMLPYLEGDERYDRDIRN